MSEQTFKTFRDLIASNRTVRDEYQRELAAASDSSAVRSRAIAAEQDYRAQLAGIDEIPTLLAHALGLDQTWPYPSEEDLELFRTQIARLGRRSVRDVDNLSLGEILAILQGRETDQQGSATVERGARTAGDVNPVLLPRWARVAFVARCARRVLRLLRADAPGQDVAEFAGFERAITAAERSAETGRPDKNLGKSAAEALEGTKSPITLLFSGSSGGSPAAKTLAPELIRSVGHASAAAAQSCLESGSEAAAASFLAARSAAEATGALAALDSMRRDWNLLQQLAQNEKWTDDSPVSPARLPTPGIKLTGLHLRGLRAIRNLDLPSDGLGWGKCVPNLILLGGVNGSGKTTLLQFLSEAFQSLLRPLSENFVAALPAALNAIGAWAEFDIEAYEFPRFTARFLVGDEDFIRRHRTDNSWYFRTVRGGGLYDIQGNGIIRAKGVIAQWFAQTAIPSVLYFPSEDRMLVVPPEGYKFAGKLTEVPQFSYRWHRPARWTDSLEAVLYAARWEDLNAIAENRDTSAGSFEAYAAAFRRFTGDRKRLDWEQAELVVRVKGASGRHDLVGLSSGEKQIVLLSGELLRLWRPGSLVMIDEPELHLHSTWQTKLYEALRFWQAERGGQVILATQSSHLFHTVEPGTTALLGVDSL